MNRILLTLGSFAALASAASAADLPSKKAPAPAPVVLAYSWTGAYVGFNIGVSGASVRGIPNVDPASIKLAKAGLSPVGFLAGVTLGYNQQFSNNVVVGAEADWAWANIRKSGAFDEDDQAGNPWNVKIRSIGTARLRLGYALDRFMPYVTGGLAWQSSNVYWNYEGNPQNYKLASFGWALGLGGEYAVTDHWTLKAEYLHLGFGAKKSATVMFSDDASIQGGKFRSHQDLVRIGLNYKF